MSIAKTKKGVWFVQYRVPGKNSPVKEYFGVGDAARDLARERDRIIKQAKTVGVRPGSNKLYLDELAQAYLLERKLSGKSPQWLEEMKTLFNEKILPLLCHVPVDDLRYPDIVRVANELWPDKEEKEPEEKEKKKAGVKLATRQRYLGYLKAAFNYGVKHELTSRNPLALWRKAKEPKIEIWLNLEGLKKIFANAAPHLQWALRVEWELGCRPGASELFALKWQHIDYRYCRIRIPGTKTTESDRVIAITPEFRDLLRKRQQSAPCEYIIDYKGRQVKKLQTSLEGAQRRAKLPYHVRFYDIRHLFATTMLVGGADMQAVSRLLGHSSVVTTHKEYYHYVPGEMERATAIRPSIE